MNEPTEEESEEKENKRDWRISAILAAVWIIAIVFVIRRETGIPVSMLAIASAFFFFLIPAMHDLVRSIERAMSAKTRTEKQS